MAPASRPPTPSAAGTSRPGDLTALDSGSTAQLRFDLGAEPTEPALLTIRWHDADGKLVSYQRTTIPPGRFAAG